MAGTQLITDYGTITTSGYWDATTIGDLSGQTWTAPCATYTGAQWTQKQQEQLSKRKKGMRIYIAATYDIDSKGKGKTGVIKDKVHVLANSDKQARDLALGHYVTLGNDITMLDQKDGWGLIVQ